MIKGKYLLLCTHCMNWIALCRPYLLLNWYTLIMFLKVLSHLGLILKIKNFMKCFKTGVLKYFKIYTKIFKYFKLKYFIVHLYLRGTFVVWGRYSVVNSCRVLARSLSQINSLVSVYVTVLSSLRSMVDFVRSIWRPAVMKSTGFAR